MIRLDLRKQWQHLYVPPAGKVALVDMPEFTFLMLDGRIEPGASTGLEPEFGRPMLEEVR